MRRLGTRLGCLALWNPLIFSGAPFFGGMQSALPYPPTWLFLVLPLPLATNWSIALNACLLGAFMFRWASRRGRHPFAAFACSAPYVAVIDADLQDYCVRNELPSQLRTRSSATPHASSIRAAVPPILLPGLWPPDRERDRARERSGPQERGDSRRELVLPHAL